MAEDFPTFATNRQDLGLTVGSAIDQMFAALRKGSAEPPTIAIATAYINPAGYALIADELNASARVRLLIGAEPDFEAAKAFVNNDADQKARLKAALDNHSTWLEAERDATGFTREAVAHAKAMVEWLRSTTGEQPKVEVRRFAKGFLHGKAFISEGLFKSAIAGSSNFTYAGLAKNAEINLGTYGPNSHAGDVMEWFEHYWQQSDVFDLASLYESQWLPHEPWVIFARMLEELYGSQIEEEGATGQLGLTAFQRDGVARMRRLMAQNGGVLVADEVGLGKSFLAGELIKTAIEVNRQRVLIICPAALKESMWEPFINEYIPSRNVDIMSFEKVRTEMTEPQPGDTNYVEKRRNYENFTQKIEDYALVVVDEAHNLRNAGTGRATAVDRLLLRGKTPKQIVLLTATPVNNSLYDLETLVKYFIRNDAQFVSIGIPSIREYIKRAQDMEPENLTPDHLFDLMEQVAVRRTRKFVKENYANEKIRDRQNNEVVISFPKPKSRRIEYQLGTKGKQLVLAMLHALSTDDDDSVATRKVRKLDPDRLILARYMSSRYLLHGDIEKFQLENSGLLRSALLKRMESSPKALLISLQRLQRAHEAFLVAVESGYVVTGTALKELTSSEGDDLDEIIEDFETNRDDVRKITEFYGEELEDDVRSDLELIKRLISLAEAANKELDPKFERLLEELEEIVSNADRIDTSGVPQGDRRKVIIFSTYSDTVIDVQEKLVEYAENNPQSRLAKYKDRIAEPILGSYKSTHEAGASGSVDQGGRAAVLAGFAPNTAGEIRDGKPIDKDIYDILVTTDVLSEGVNLQQAGQIINYDLPWNPMRIVQRHGRIDRIGSLHPEVHLGLYFPNELLDEMLGLERTLSRKLAQANAAVGEHIEALSSGKEMAEVILADKSMEKMDELLETRGGVSSQSGEEYRHRLRKHLKNTTAAKESKALPYGSGSGFVNQNLSGNAYVFCVKIAGRTEPWFRYVEVDNAWNVKHIEDKPMISAETRTSLIAADPMRSDQVRLLSDAAYSGVFDAWQIAQSDIYEKWMQLTDPANLQASPPKSFRTAFALVRDHGAFLGADVQRDLMAKLSTVPSHKVQTQVGRAMEAALSERRRIEVIAKLIEDAGIVAAPQVEALPRVNREQIRLVSWMAITGGNSATH